jgi:MFS family permease
MSTPTITAPDSAKQTKNATASGWIGSALEYYDFFIYAQAAALIFPTVMFDKSDPRMGIIGALGTYVVGYVARPIGAFVLGSWGDKYGRKNVLVLCMLMMGLSTMLVAVLPTYAQVGFLAPALLMVLRLVQGFAVAGEISGASSMILESAPFGRRAYLGSFALQGTQFGQILAAAVFLPLAHFLPTAAMNGWGWRIPFAMSALVVLAGYFIRRNVHETHANKDDASEASESPIKLAFSESGGTIFRVFCMALTNIIAVTTSIFGATYATNKAYGVGFHADVYLWIPLVGNLVACVLIPMVGNLADRIGRRPCIMVSTAACGLMSYGYLYAIHMHNLPLAVGFSIVMWGAVYQGYNAIFPAYYPELFPANTRVTGMAIAQNLGTVASSAMSLVFPLVAPPGSHHVVLIVGSLTLLLCLMACGAAWRSPETYRFRSEDLGVPGAQPVPEEEYKRLRGLALTAAKQAKQRS